MKFVKYAGTACLMICGLPGLSSGVLAADPEAGGSDWNFELGAMARVAPDYEGSDDYEFSPAPLIEIEWRERVRLTTKGGPGLYADLLKGNGFTVTTGISYEFGRDEDDNDALAGLGDLEVGAVGNLALSYERGPFGLTLGLARDVGGDREGLAASLEGSYSRAFLDERLMFRLTPSISWADDSYMENSFGISAAQSLASARGYRAYEAGSGLKDAGLGLTAIYRVTDNVMLLGRAQYSQLLGDAADSPIVDREGSAGQFEAGLGLVYRW